MHSELTLSRRLLTFGKSTLASPFTTKRTTSGSSTRFMKCKVYQCTGICFYTSSNATYCQKECSIFGSVASFFVVSAAAASLAAWVLLRLLLLFGCFLAAAFAATAVNVLAALPAAGFTILYLLIFFRHYYIFSAFFFVTWSSGMKESSSNGHSLRDLVAKDKLTALVSSAQVGLLRLVF